MSKLSILLISTLIILSSCKKDVESSFNCLESEKTIELSEIQSYTEGEPLDGICLATSTNADSSPEVKLEWINANNGAISFDQDGMFYVNDASLFDYNTWQADSSAYVYQVKASIQDESNTEEIVTVTLKYPPQGGGGGTNDSTVQERLTNGETPFQIYNSDNSLLDSLYGKSYEGGLIFYMDINDGSGLVAHPTDLNTEFPFDTTAFANLSTTGATSTAVGDGAANTTTIVNSIGGALYAAYECENLDSQGYTTWFLPTLGELDLMYSNLHAIGAGSFSLANYWSSSEFNATSAWARDFSVGSGQTSSTITKVNLHKVRPVKAFN